MIDDGEDEENKKSNQQNDNQHHQHQQQQPKPKKKKKKKSPLQCTYCSRVFSQKYYTAIHEKTTCRLRPGGIYIFMQWKLSNTKYGNIEKRNSFYDRQLFFVEQI